MGYSFPYSFILLLLVSSIATFSFDLSLSQTSTATTNPSLVPGLTYSFYKYFCPNLETLVRNYLTNAFKSDTGLAAGLLRIHFHDCFVQGCDGSVLLDGTPSNPSEKKAPPNLTLRPTAFKAISNIKALVTRACGNVVSCSDITALASRDSVYLSGGPYYSVPLGRRDSLSFASQGATLSSLPPPTATVTVLLDSFYKLGLDMNDLVALSGAHTIGIGHCTSFQNRLFPSQDPTMDKSYANNLRQKCPARNTANFTVLDPWTPNKFDNKYFLELVNGLGLFYSDQGLYLDHRTRPIVTKFGSDKVAFFNQFVYSVTKMGQLGVLTGHQGLIRSDCSRVAG